MRWNGVGVRIVFVVCLALVIWSGAAAGFAQTGPDASVAWARAKHLQRGINLSEWFAQVYDPKGYTRGHFDTWNTAQDIALIKRWAGQWQRY